MRDKMGFKPLKQRLLRHSGSFLAQGSVFFRKFAPLLQRNSLHFITKTSLGMVQNCLEKLQFNDEKNILIQGLPSSIEKQFLKITFAKNVTPLLKTRKIDFALVFALSENQLKGILREVIPALNEDVTFWVAYPKVASKISTDLNRDCSWNCLAQAGFEPREHVPLDHVWTALQFSRVPCDVEN